MAVVTVMPRGHEWTVADLAGLPDDGLQYELFDGVLLVSPAPTPTHQRAVFRIAKLLDSVCPRDFEVFVAPFDFQPSRRRSVQPDVLVVRSADVRPRRFVGVPVLTVEVLSDSARSKDRIVKQEVYRAAGFRRSGYLTLTMPMRAGRPASRRTTWGKGRTSTWRPARGRTPSGWTGPTQ